jgi:hypothetical protein
MPRGNVQQLGNIGGTQGQALSVVVMQVISHAFNGTSRAGQPAGKTRAFLPAVKFFLAS